MGKKKSGAKSGTHGAKKAGMGDFVVVSADEDEEGDENLTIYVHDVKNQEKDDDTTAAGGKKCRKKGGSGV